MHEIRQPQRSRRLTRVCLHPPSQIGTAPRPQTIPNARLPEESKSAQERSQHLLSIENPAPCKTGQLCPANRRRRSSVVVSSTLPPCIVHHALRYLARPNPIRTVLNRPTQNGHLGRSKQTGLRFVIRTTFELTHPAVQRPSRPNHEAAAGKRPGLTFEAWVFGALFSAASG